MPDLSDIAATFGIWWPDADPTQLGQAAQIWTSLATAVEGVLQACQGQVDSVCGNNSGQAISAFDDYWTQHWAGSGWLETNANYCRRLAAALNSYAQEVETARSKVTSIIEGLLETTVASIALGFITFGITDALAAGAIAGAVLEADEAADLLSAVTDTLFDQFLDDLPGDVAQDIAKNLIDDLVGGDFNPVEPAPPAVGTAPATPQIGSGPGWDTQVGSPSATNQSLQYPVPTPVPSTAPAVPIVAGAVAGAGAAAAAGTAFIMPPPPSSTSISCEPTAGQSSAGTGSEGGVPLPPLGAVPIASGAPTSGAATDGTTVVVEPGSQDQVVVEPGAGGGTEVIVSPGTSATGTPTDQPPASPVTSGEPATPIIPISPTPPAATIPITTAPLAPTGGPVTIPPPGGAAPIPIAGGGGGVPLVSAAHNAPPIPLVRSSASGQTTGSPPITPTPIPPGTASTTLTNASANHPTEPGDSHSDEGMMPMPMGAGGSAGTSGAEATPVRRRTRRPPPRPDSSD